MTAATRLQLAMDLIQRTEVCVCEKCGHTHEVELGIISKEDAKKLLSIEGHCICGAQVDSYGCTNIDCTVGGKK